MLPLELLTHSEIARLLSGRARTLRLQRGWTQQEIAARSGLTLPTYRRFERTGQISLDRLLKVTTVLDARAGFDRIFALPPAQSLAELAERTQRSTRKRGRRTRAG
jgi:transcriptional regulator with XRE-family HTH domain